MSSFIYQSLDVHRGPRGGGEAGVGTAARPVDDFAVDWYLPAVWGTVAGAESVPQGTETAAAFSGFAVE